MEITYSLYDKNTMQLDTGLDLFPKGFTETQLRLAYHRLFMDADDPAGLVLESANYREIDEYYNPGEVIPDAVLEAVITSFSRLPQRMKFVAKKIEKYLPNDLIVQRGEDGDLLINDGEPAKVKKVKGIPTVVGLIRLSDGQSITAIFHAPEGEDRKTITGDDQLTAFRWLLNRKDITGIIAEEGGKTSVDNIAKKIAQIAGKNSAAFQKRQAANKDVEKAIAAVEKETAEITQRNENISRKNEELQPEVDRLTAYRDELKRLIEEAKARNADLENQIQNFNSGKKGRPEPGDVKGGSPEPGGNADIETPSEPAPLPEMDYSKGMDAAKAWQTFRHRAESGAIGGYEFSVVSAEENKNTIIAFRWQTVGEGHEAAVIVKNFITENGSKFIAVWHLTSPDQYNGAYTSGGKVKGDKPFPGKADMLKKKSPRSGRWDTVYKDVEKTLLTILPDKEDAVDNTPEPEPRAAEPETATQSPDIKAMSDADFKAARDALENDGKFADALVMDATRRGTDADIAEAETIRASEKRTGSMTEELYTRYQELTDRLNGKAGAVGTDTQGQEPEAHAETPDEPEQETPKTGKLGIYHYRYWEKNGKVRVYFDQNPGKKIGISFYWDKDSGMSKNPDDYQNRGLRKDLLEAQAFCEANFSDKNAGSETPPAPEPEPAPAPKSAERDRVGDKVYRQIIGLSGGTFGNLINNNRYDEIDRVQNEFAAFYLNSKKEYLNWDEAWKDFDAVRDKKESPGSNAVKILNDIIAGQYDKAIKSGDVNASDLSEKTLIELEEAGIFDQYEDLWTQADNHTTKMAKLRESKKKTS